MGRRGLGGVRWERRSGTCLRWERGNWTRLRWGSWKCPRWGSWRSPCWEPRSWTRLPPGADQVKCPPRERIPADKRPGLESGVPQEIAHRLAWIDGEKLGAPAEPRRNSGYGDYLLKPLDRSAYQAPFAP